MISNTGDSSDYLLCYTKAFGHLFNEGGEEELTHLRTTITDLEAKLKWQHLRHGRCY